MELRPNHKQTDIGIVPIDWEVRNLDSLGRRGRPTIKAGPFGSSLTKDTYVADGYKVYGQEQVIRGDYLYGDYYISSAHFNQLKSCAVEPGDVLLSLVGTAGRVLIIPDNAPAGIINPRLIRFSFDQDVISPRFFKFVIESDAYQSLLSRSAQGGTMGVLNAGLLRPISIALPKISEQEAIAEALCDADALIESLEQLFTKKRQIKEGSIQELLTGKKRLPGYGQAWQEVLFGEMGKCYRGVSYDPTTDLRPSDTPSTARLLRSNNVQESTVLLSSIQYVESTRVSEVQRLRSGDILICMANGSRDLVGKVGRFAVDDSFLYTFGAFMGCFRPYNNHYDPRFIFYLFQTEAYRSHVAVLLAGSSINNLTPHNVEACGVKIPVDKKEQTAISQILSDMDAELAALEAKLAKARQIKQGMMQELLTGRIRLV